MCRGRPVVCWSWCFAHVPRGQARSITRTLSAEFEDKDHMLQIVVVTSPDRHPGVQVEPLVAFEKNCRRLLKNATEMPADALMCQVGFALSITRSES